MGRYRSATIPISFLLRTPGGRRGVVAYQEQRTPRGDAGLPQILEQPRRDRLDVVAVGVPAEGDDRDLPRGNLLDPHWFVGRLRNVGPCSPRGHHERHRPRRR